MTVLIDNYDSFSYNLYQMLGTIRPDISVVRNDAVTMEDIRAMKPDHIVISPGPGRPEDAGISMEAVRTFAGSVPILGVCLGHQAICAVYGMTITRAKTLMHGKRSEIFLTQDCPLFRGLPETIRVGRYHSLAADADTLPPELRVTARAQDREIMAVQHTAFPVFGVQFHPESILTPEGAAICKHFLEVKA